MHYQQGNDSRRIVHWIVLDPIWFNVFMNDLGDRTQIHLRHLWWHNVKHTREDNIRKLIDLDTLDVKLEIQWRQMQSTTLKKTSDTQLQNEKVKRQQSIRKGPAATAVCWVNMSRSCDTPGEKNKGKSNSGWNSEVSQVRNTTHWFCSVPVSQACTAPQCPIYSTHRNRQST